MFVTMLLVGLRRLPVKAGSGISRNGTIASSPARISRSVSAVLIDTSPTRNAKSASQKPPDRVVERDGRAARLHHAFEQDGSDAARGEVRIGPGACRARRFCSRQLHPGWLTGARRRASCRGYASSSVRPWRKGSISCTLRNWSAMRETSGPMSVSAGGGSGGPDEDAGSEGCAQPVRHSATTTGRPILPRSPSEYSRRPRCERRGASCEAQRGRWPHAAATRRARLGCGGRPRSARRRRCAPASTRRASCLQLTRPTCAAHGNTRTGS